MRIRAEENFEKILDLFPNTVEVFERYGFSGLTDPNVRHAAKLVTIQEAAHLQGVALDQLLRELNRAIGIPENARV